jgi:hypothetical protein
MGFDLLLSTTLPEVAVFSNDECDPSFNPSPFLFELAALEFDLEPIMLLIFLAL